MKPIKLILTAFGAYKEREVIDFKALQGHHLFVISGNTGAGKTTVFDGICFALYGSASGTDRENSGMLRSHFAEDDVHTTVDFEFEIKGRIFRVFRQLAHKKTGNKSKTGDKNELYEQTDQGEMPIVDRQIVSEVNQKIEQLIGLTEDQFKQIVMLPQGEFRKLLTSETENKEAILRRLFKTERYKEMHQLLKDKIDVIEKDFSKEKQRLDHYVESIQTTLIYREGAPIFTVLEQEFYHIGQIIAALEEERSFLDEKVGTDEKIYEEKQAFFGRKQEHYHQGVALNERFVLFDKQKKALTSLMEQAEKYTIYESQLKAAQQSNILLPYENYVKEREEENKQILQQVEQNEKELQIADQARQKALEFHQKLESMEAERNNRKAKIRHYEELLPVVKEANQTKERLANEKAALNQMEITLQQINKDQTAKETEITKLKQKIRDEEEIAATLHDRQAEVLRLREKYKVMLYYFQTNEKIIASKQALKEEEEIHLKIEGNYKYQENLWLDNQALVLAEHLVEGKACPVCGSADHPKKASPHGQAVSREQLDQIKKEMEQQLNKVNHMRSTYQSNENDLKKALEQINELQITTEITTDSLHAFAEEGKEVGKQVEYIQKVMTELQKNKEALERIDISYEKMLKEKQQLEYTAHQKEIAYSAAKATFTEKISAIPKELQDLSELEQTLKQMKDIAEKADKTWQQAQQHLKETEATHTTAQATLKNRNEQLASNKLAVEKARTTFQEKLKEADFTGKDAYEKAKMALSEQEKLSVELEAYKEKKMTLTQQIKEMEAELKDKEKSDIEALQVVLTESKQAYEQALTTWNQSKLQHTQVGKFIEQIKQAEEKSAGLEKKLAAMTDVYNMVRGQNEKKISFERYLQIDYLDQIIQAANERFKQLMNGQFYLLRSDRQETHGKQSGLAIDVYDGYTGQTRDVKTLSGGEKFIASLCLALGMSDVIQSYQGSISIETMFIDEGFGSLDEESLHKSIDALIQIQQTGRMIGVISHVEELKNIFPAMLKVTKTKEGYSKTAFIIK